MHKLQDSDFIISLTLGNRKYELAQFFQRGESIGTKELLKRARLLEAKPRKSDVRWVLGHQTELNPMFRDRFDLVFITPSGLAIVSWDRGRWIRDEQIEEHITEADCREDEDLRYDWGTPKTRDDYGWRLVRRVK